VRRPRRGAGRRASAAARAFRIGRALCVVLAALQPALPARAGEDAAGSAAAPTPVAPASSSQEGGTPALPPETVTVREPADRLRADPTAFGTVIEAAQWADRITTLPALLREAVGVQVKSIGDTFSTVSIRGSTAEQVMVYLDGVPLNRAAGGAVNLADIPVAQVERIEVYRGMTPASLPEASIGGAILITTRAPKGPASGDGWISAGSLGSAEASVSCGEEKARGGWRLAADGGASDGDFLFLDNNGTEQDPADDEVTHRVNNDFRRGHALARGHLRTGETDLTFEADGFRREEGVPGIDALQSEEARLETSRLILSAGAERAGLLDGRLVLRGALSWRDEQERYDGGGTIAPFARSSDNTIDSTSLSGGGSLIAGARQALSFLAAVRKETADLRDPSPGGGEVGTADRRVLSATIEDQILFAAGRVQVVPSLRYEASASDMTPGPAAGVLPTSGDLDTSAVTGRLGVRGDLSPGWSLRANTGNYERVPDFTELYGHRGAVLGNPGLVPEHGTNADLGLAYDAPHAAGPFRSLHAEGTLFATDARDLIVYVPTSFGIVVAQNIGAARIRGVELSVAGTLGARLSGGFNIVRQEAIETGDTFREGFPLPGRSELEASTSLGGVWGRTRLAWNFTYVGPNNLSTVGSESGELPARYLHDLSCRVLLPHRLEATVQVHNLFDDHNVDLYRYPLPGRRYEARLAWAF
jgi:iron complex outermembrane receptor protein